MGSMEESEKKRPHAICIPCPAQGHINAMLRLAKLLHHNGFHITFVHTQFTYNRILASNPSSLDGFPDFRFEAIPDGLPPSDPGATQDTEALCLAIRNDFYAPFRDLLKRLDDPDSGLPTVSCIVSDLITSFTIDVAEELGIPVVFLYSASACGSLPCLYFKEFIERGIVPFKSEDDLTNGYLDDTWVDWIPGLKNVRLRDIPTFIRTTNPDDILFNFLKDELQQSFRATAIILNTFDDLERPVLDAMSQILPPMYTVGPLNLLSRRLLDSSLTSIASNLWKEDSGCLEWLQGREPNSVMYLNFGSIAVVTNQQLLEIAWGLANSGHYFLWVIRPDLVKGESAVLPTEFLAETTGRGFLTSWCPQEEVLLHPAIGGFLSHCGWNSTMESMSCGVPMICWPYFGDQQINCRYLCSEWGIGEEIDNDVGREEVERVIREVMEGEKGKEMRGKAKEWKENAVRSTEPGGSSFLNLERVIKEVLLRGKSH